MAGTDLYNSIVSAARNQVDKDIDAKVPVYLSISSVIFVVLGLLGVKSLSDLKANLMTELRANLSAEIIEELRKSMERQADLSQQEIKKSIRHEIDEQLSDLRTRFEKENAINRLKAFADKIEKGDGFTRSERSAIMEQLEVLKDYQKIRDRDDFESILELIVDNFFAADLSAEIDRIVSDYEIIVTRSVGIIITLIQDYGMRVLGEESPDSEDVRHYAMFAKLARQYKLQAAIIPYILVYENTFRVEGWKRRLDAAIEDIKYEKDEDKQRILESLQKHCDPKHISKVPTARVVRMANRFSEFLKAHQHELEVVGVK
ncbi:MAG: hypothetical protein P4L33_11345 [Capsulimonadaceae bacterium]|nr:hypothetical protein [Capsulimonadaceae bacterium]